jgi:hypothetical protein
MNIEADAIVARMVSEFGFSEEGARRAVQNLSTSHPAVQRAFEKWWRGGGLDDQLRVRGFTLKEMVEQGGRDPMMAFVIMANMLPQPEPVAQIEGAIMNIEASTVVARLVSEFGYSEEGARRAVQNLSTSHPAVQQAFEKWWRGEGLDDQLQVRGFTVRRLVERRGFHPMFALITMADLLREPELVVQMLRRGFDSVAFEKEGVAEGQMPERLSKEEATDAERARAETEATMAIVEAWGKEGLIQLPQAAILLTTLKTIQQRLIENPDFDATSMIKRLPEKERKILEEAAEEAFWEYDYFLPERKKR